MPGDPWVGREVPPLGFRLVSGARTSLMEAIGTKPAVLHFYNGG